MKDKLSYSANHNYRDGYYDAIAEINEAMYHECFETDHHEDGLQKWDSGNWFRYKLFENVMEELLRK